MQNVVTHYDFLDVSVSSSTPTKFMDICFLLVNLNKSICCENKELINTKTHQMKCKLSQPIDRKYGE